MNSKPILFDIRSETGQAYIQAMQLAGEYAYAGREVVVARVLEILGNPGVTYSVHNHHNFAWREKHRGEMYWVVRKGCTPAFPGQQGFIGSTMEDISVIVEGVESELSARALYSTVHGAGRVMSRTKAAGRRRWVRDRDGGRRPEFVSRGTISFGNVKKRLKQKGVVLRGGAADEAPECYKHLDEVLEKHKGTIKTLFRLEPIGVAMAGPDIYDPYKD